jgi:hypothetical protein
MHVRLLLLLLIDFLGLPILPPPGGDALSRARKQAHPSAGRAVSLVRNSWVLVAALASRPQGRADDDGEGVRVQEETAAPCWSCSASRHHVNQAVRRVPVIAATGCQGAAGRAAVLAFGCTTHGWAVWPHGGDTGRGARRDIEVAVDGTSTRTRPMDIKPPSMVKKTSLASHSRPALLLLPRIRSTTLLSASLRDLQFDGTIEMVMK